MNTRRAQDGVTLIELLVAMFIAGVLVMFVTQFFASQNKTYVAQMDSTELRGNLRAVADLIQRELRNAGYDPRSVGFPAVTRDTSGRFFIRSDFNGDGDIMDRDEQVMYYLDRVNHVLMRMSYGYHSTTSAPEIVIDNIDTMSVVLKDRFGIPLPAYSNPDSVRQVFLMMRVLTERANGAQASEQGKQSNDISVTIVPRNLDLPVVPMSYDTTSS